MFPFQSCLDFKAKQVEGEKACQAREQYQVGIYSLSFERFYYSVHGLVSGHIDEELYIYFTLRKVVQEQSNL